MKLKYTHSKSRPSQNVRDTSIANYQDIKQSTKTGTETAAAVKYLATDGPASRRMISNATGIPLNNMTRIAFDLCKDGKIMELSNKKKCALSGVTVYYLTIPPAESSK